MSEAEYEKFFWSMEHIDAIVIKVCTAAWADLQFKARLPSGQRSLASRADQVVPSQVAYVRGMTWKYSRTTSSNGTGDGNGLLRELISSILFADKQTNSHTDHALTSSDSNGNAKSGSA